MKMLVIFGILVMFTEAGVGLLSMNPVCRFNQSDPCYGAVGRPLYLQLPYEYELHLKKIINGAPTERIFKFINHKITLKHPDYPRWQFVADNRTMIISSAEKRDSGRYILDTFDSRGNNRVYHLQLVIEGGSTQPLITSHTVVSSVTVTDSCLSIEKRNVYCSSDGDNVQYSWTFQHTHQLADVNQTLLLDKEVHGSVTCYAQNHVSHGKKTIEIQQCPGDIVFVSVWVLEIIILLSLLGGFHIYARIQRKQSKRAAESKEEENLEQEDREHHYRR
ncbi:carcinoembryonic antigen-related cell adhesion molecule 20-like isoform X6 [Pygocentrus nattereri]|uniref:carcinoembryonic antigen-related cell adhesion molecule 20-like isoform X6 n=1 Tax=Pygocentrus nattereri TaxID=42514 RepID=UPI001891186A|nr:carcinoembryonic antigen-related cell adhesion molecule 20-like isoform X6 [Pygocentrus nattereri]